MRVYSSSHPRAKFILSFSEVAATNARKAAATNCVQELGYIWYIHKIKFSYIRQLKFFITSYFILSFYSSGDLQFSSLTDLRQNFFYRQRSATGISQMPQFVLSKGSEILVSPSTSVLFK